MAPDRTIWCVFIFPILALHSAAYGGRAVQRTCPSGTMHICEGVDSFRECTRNSKTGVNEASEQVSSCDVISVDNSVCYNVRSTSVEAVCGPPLADCMEEGYFAVPGRNDTYMECKEDKNIKGQFSLKLRSCLKGFIFVDTAEHCVPESLAGTQKYFVPGFAERTPPAVADCVPTERRPDPMNCRTYLECNAHGVLQNKTCPNNRLFDEHENQCLPFVKCGERYNPNAFSKQQSPTQLPPTPSMIPEEMCRIKGMRKEDPTSCRNFKYCSANNQWIVIHCPMHAYYNKDTRLCVMDKSVCRGRPTTE